MKIEASPVYCFGTLHFLTACVLNCCRIWTIEEDEMLKNLIVEHGTSNWTKVGESFPERTGKQCRERWYNHLDPCVKKGEWTSEVS
jgi:Myb-like DNA-binding domain